MTNNRWILRCDGGSRGNPGPGALGYVLIRPDGNEADARGEFIGDVTNNVAEYRALIAGLESAIENDAQPLSVCMDSELVIRQMTGQYRVKNEGLKPLNAKAKVLSMKLPDTRWESVPRAENARADGLVNQTLDDILGSESPR